MTAARMMDRDVFVSRINLEGVHSSTLHALACSVIFHLNAFFHIHRYTRISKSSISVAIFGFAVYIVNMRVTCPLLFRVDAPLFGDA